MNPPVGFSGDHNLALSVLGLRGLVIRPGLSNVGVQSMGTRMAAVRSWEANGELRRLTIRGLRRLVVREAFRRALSLSTSSKCRLRSLGLAGGKGPGRGLLSAQQLDVAGK